MGVEHGAAIGADHRRMERADPIGEARTAVSSKLKSTEILDVHAHSAGAVPIAADTLDRGQANQSMSMQRSETERKDA